LAGPLRIAAVRSWLFAEVQVSIHAVALDRTKNPPPALR